MVPLSFESVVELAQRTVTQAVAMRCVMTTAESCTGGLIAGALTAVAGSSAVIDRTFVTYSNEAKQEVLGVPAELLATHGAVSEQVAEAMAKGCLLAVPEARLAMAVTGIAGPGGGSDEKPVGLVFLAVAFRTGPADPISMTADQKNYGDLGRHQVRLATVVDALAMADAALQRLAISERSDSGIS